MHDGSGSDIPWKGAGRDAWLDEVRTWIDAALRLHGLALGGEVEFVRDRAWSAVVRAPLRDSDESVYFKACGGGGAHEPEVVEALALMFPDRITMPLAINVGHAWMLMRDGGVTLRDHLNGASPISAWWKILPQYAEIQMASSDNIQRWLDLGVPDRRPERLPGMVENLIRDDEAMCVGHPDGLTAQEREQMLQLIDRLERGCTVLRGVVPSSSLEHGDLHDGNVLVDGDTFRIFDWGDVSITHPFCSLLVTIHMSFGPLGKATDWDRVNAMCIPYLQTWEPRIDLALGLIRTVNLRALWVGHVIRALDWHHMLNHADDESREAWKIRVVTWLRLWVGCAYLTPGGPVDAG